MSNQTKTESEIFALGMQVEALKARLKLSDMMRGALADIADSEDEHGTPSSRAWMMNRAKDALAAFDAVPGDVVSRVVGTIGGRVAAEADAAQQMVAEMRVRLSRLLDQMHERTQPYVDGIVYTMGTDAVGHHGAALAILEASHIIAGRWCLASERDEALSRESELGLQVDAQAQRLRLSEAVVDVARYGQPTLAMRNALAAWDAVPGDVKA
jgi:hypothetical protein